MVGLGAVGLAAETTLALGSADRATSFRAVAADTLPFRHGDHANLDCRTCHANARPTVRTNQVWCRECHHEGRGFDRCGECHPASNLARPYGVRQRLSWTSGGAVSRSLPFDHTDHAGVECGACHRGAPMPSPDRPCADCHAEHHRAEADCLACHEEPRPGVHTLAVHTTSCGGSSCHGTAGRELAAFGDAPNLCLSCHQDQRDHERGERCTRCHLLGPRDERGRSGGAS